MRNYIFNILLLTTICSSNIFAQNDEALALQSLHFLDRQFSLQLIRLKEPVLISINNYDYVCNEFLKKDSSQSIIRLRFKYKIEKKDESKYEFYLKIVSEYRGSFKATESAGVYYISNLDYVHISH